MPLRPLVRSERLSRSHLKNWQDDHAPELDHGEEVSDMAPVAHDQSPEVLQPGEKAFDLPATPAPTQGASVLGHFMRRSAGHVHDERKAAGVCPCHDLAAFAPLGFPNPSAPFWAGANVPSMNASRISIPPRSRRSSARAIRMRSNTLLSRRPSLAACPAPGRGNQSRNQLPLLVGQGHEDPIYPTNPTSIVF